MLPSHVRGQRWAILYSLIAIAILVLTGYHLLTLHPTRSLTHHVLYGVFTIAASLAIGNLAIWHYRNPLPPHQYRRIGVWVLASTLFITASGIISLYVGSRAVLPFELWEVIQLMGSVSIAVGLLIGTNEARALSNAEAAAKATTLESERERLQLLNDLLRHYVLNGLTVINGFAQQIESEESRDQQEAGEVIQRQATEVANLVDQLGVLTKTEWDRREICEADIIREIESCASDKAERDIDLTLPEDVPEMYANVGYDNGLEMLVDVLVKSMETGGTLSANVDSEEGTISISVQPATIPENVIDELFKPIGSEIGLKLYLARRILEPAIELDGLSQDGDRISIVLRGEFVP